jgi:hypothetical protein
MNEVDEDVLKHIVSFLDNRSTIETLVLSRSINRLFLQNKNTYKNIFTSMCVQPDHDMIERYRRYMDHSKSIQNVVIYRMIEPDVLWPFQTKNITYIGCRFSSEFDDHKNKHNKRIKILSH